MSGTGSSDNSMPAFYQPSSFDLVETGACIVSCVQRVSTPFYPSVHPSLCPSIHLSVYPSVFFFYSLTSPLQPKCSGDLKYGPFPPARDWGSRVSGLVAVLTTKLQALNFFRIPSSYQFVLGYPFSISFPFWAAAQKGRCLVGHRGEPLRPSDNMSPPPRAYQASNFH